MEPPYPPSPHTHTHTRDQCTRDWMMGLAHTPLCCTSSHDTGLMGGQGVKVKGCVFVSGVSSVAAPSLLTSPALLLHAPCHREAGPPSAHSTAQVTITCLFCRSFTRHRPFDLRCMEGQAAIGPGGSILGPVLRTKLPLALEALLLASTAAGTQPARLLWHFCGGEMQYWLISCVGRETRTDRVPGS